MNTKKIIIDIPNIDEKTVFNEKPIDNKLLRIDCWNNTKQLCKTMPNPPPSIREHYDNNYLLTNNSNKKSIVAIYDMDTIDCALMFERPLVLNMSDDEYAGGWVNLGSAAQEESLFRRTNYFRTLTQELYPIMDDESVYSPNVSVIKSSEKNGWKRLDTPRFLDFIACPAIKYPFLDDEEHLSEEDSTLLENKIKMIIQVAKKYYHNTIIFGAMGCGAWKNPPYDVSSIFRKVLKEYDGIIENFVFAILRNYNDDSTDSVSQDNYHVFKKVLML